MTVERWRSAVDRLWRRNRVHVSTDMSAAYRDLAAIYPDTTVLGVASGERCGSWLVGPGWEVEGARLVAPDGEVVVDWRESPLGLFTYSPPVQAVIGRDELEAHLFSIPSMPERTPFHFRNMYRHWAPEWGFCLPDKRRQSLPGGNYTVDIRTRFQPETMEMAEQVHRGELADSVLLVGHFDHPWMLLDGLIGCIAGHEILSRLGPTRFTWRMLSTVEIIGSVFYADRWAKPNHVREAMFLATAGAKAPICYQTSAAGQSVLDRAMRHLLSTAAPDAAIHPFRMGPLGNDEIAYDVAGVDIPCGSLMRAPFGQYHTDADNPTALDEAGMEAYIALVLRLIGIVERNAVLEPLFSALPCLSAPELDLYLSVGSMSNTVQPLNAASRRLMSGLLPEAARETEARAANLNWMMSLLPAMADGRHTVLDLAEKVGLPFEAVDFYTDLWREKDLLAKRPVNPFR